MNEQDETGKASVDIRENIRWNRDVWGSMEGWEARGYGLNWEKGSSRPQKYSVARDLLRSYLHPFLAGDPSSILEIGPGAGKFTTELVNMCDSLTLVDLNQVCIDICRERFKYYDHIAYHTNNGYSLEMVENNSVDLIFSYDCFVHVSRELVARYVAEFPYKLRDGGIAWIHHSSVGARRIGMRSDMTDAAMRDFARNSNLLVLAQIYLYLIKEPRPHYGDVITVMKKIPPDGPFVSKSADEL